ncbi:MAG: FliH/SctL family protein [Thermodesulfobacteriota bacterium]
MLRATVVSGDDATRFQLPSFEGAEGPRAAARTERKGRPKERTPADVEREAYEKGFEEGRKAGAAAAAREAAPLLEGLRSAAAGTIRLKEQIAQEAEPQVVALAVAVARRVLIGELSGKPERIAAIVKEAIRRIERAGPVTVRVHPDLSALIAGLKEGVTDFQAEILLDVDPSVPPFGPIVTGATEEVLTDVDEQIRVIMDELRSDRAAR